MIALLGGAAILIWLVISHSLAAYLADAAPRSALWLDPRNPTALLNLADRSFNASEGAAALPIAARGGRAPKPDESAGDGPAQFRGQAFNVGELKLDLDLPAIRDWAQSALLRDPLNARALRVLGQAASIGNDNANAAKYMAAAARLSVHESVALYWMMRNGAAVGDPGRAVYYADALLRADPELFPYVAPLLARFAEQKETAGLVKSILKVNPPWRTEFLRGLLGYISDARTPLDLLLSLKASAAPPKPDEVDDYLNFLVTRRFYELAYYTWLQFLPPAALRAAGFLFNGNFAMPPSGSPFDWVFTQGSGVDIDIVPISDKTDGHALLIDFLYGRADYHGVSELVVLAPGSYRFSGRYKGGLVGPRGLQWRLECANDARKRLGETAMIAASKATWQDLGFTFTVPGADCPAQYVRLDLDARTAADDLVSGSIMFDGLQIARAAAAPPSSGAGR